MKLSLVYDDTSIPILTEPDVITNMSKAIFELPTIEASKVDYSKGSRKVELKFVVDEEAKALLVNVLGELGSRRWRGIPIELVT
jgi:hypothetical protein